MIVTMMSDCYTLSRRPRVGARSYAGSYARLLEQSAPIARADPSPSHMVHQLHSATKGKYDQSVIRFGLKRLICHLLGVDSSTTIV
jgi:hypothetical protein